MATDMTAAQIAALNKMNRAAQNVTLGTKLSNAESEIDNLQTDNAYLMANGYPNLTGLGNPMRVFFYTTAPALGTATAVHAAVTLGAAAQDVTTAITNPAVPRVVTIKGNAAGIAGNVVITGTNVAGAAITETIALNEATEVVGTKAFKTITNINFPAKTNGSGDTVSIGTGNKIGLPHAISSAAKIINAFFDGAADAGTFTLDDDEVEKNVFALAGTLNGTKKLEFLYAV